MMRFLIDNSLSPRLADGLRECGHDAVHMRELLPVDAADVAIFELASEQDRVVLAQDTDFGTILAQREADRPSVVLFRGRRKATADVLDLFQSMFPSIVDDLSAGAVVVFDDTRVRIRRLPIA
jgi:predicted nuclease of predicted toxin-antitoxin system